MLGWFVLLPPTFTYLIRFPLAEKMALVLLHDFLFFNGYEAHRTSTERQLELEIVTAIEPAGFHQHRAPHAVENALNRVSLNTCFMVVTVNRGFDWDEKAELQTQEINVPDRIISSKPIKVISALLADQIAAQPASIARIVIAVAVVDQVRFVVLIFRRKPQRV